MFIANVSIREAAPFLTIFPISSAWEISCSLIPSSLALLTLYSKHEWQFAATDAPTAINVLILFSMVNYSFSLSLILRTSFSKALFEPNV